MSTAKRVIKNSAYLYGKIAITSICLILSTRYILKGLGVEDFGIYNLICSTVVMLSFLNESMTAATQRFMSYAEGEGKKEKSVKIFNTSYTVHIIIALLIALVFLLLMPIVFGEYLKIPENRINSAKIVYLFMIATTCSSIITVPYNAVLIAHENLRYFSFIGSLVGVLKLLAAISLIYISIDRLITYGLLILLIVIFEIITIRFYCHSKYPECKIDLFKETDKTTLKEMLSFAGWQMTYSASSILSIQGMSLILNSFFGTIMNAAQGIARQVCGQMMTLSGTMMSAMNPVIVKKAGARETESMLRTAIKGSKLSYFLVIIIALPIMFEIPFLLNIWLTEVPDYAIQFCRWEVIQQIIASFTVALVTLISGVGDIRAFQTFSAITYVLRLPIIYMVLWVGCVPVTAYYVSTLAVVALCIGRVYFAYKKCQLPVKEYLKKVIYPCLLVTLIMSIVVACITLSINESWIRLLITLLVSTSACLLGGYYIVLDYNERALIHNMLIGIKNKFIQK